MALAATYFSNLNHIDMSKLVDIMLVVL
jgi:hypothetical protein